MTQRFSLYEDLSIEENLDFVARVYAVPLRRAAVRDALERLGLVDRRGQLAGTLSGGWKQRLALAACLLHQPHLLLLDEPTAGVDPKARRDFWEHIHALSAGGMTVLVSTHYMDEAERCHRLAYISYGRLLATGTPAEVVEQSHLTTFVVTRRQPGHEAEVNALAQRLAADPGVTTVVPFGNALHVSGHDAGALEAAVTRLVPRVAFEVQPSLPSLEDVFVSLMEGAVDNMARPAA
jgi:ABC-2 type transport system ATP-binding protein